jgi:uncharacterized damage-inducible protein DinB
VSAILRAVLDHHIWSNETLYGFCERLSSEQLGLAMAGTYGTVHRTLLHLAQGEQLYLSRIPESGVEVTIELDADPRPTVAEAGRALRRAGDAWRAVVERWPDDLQIAWVTSEGYHERGSIAFSIVQMLDHGAEHRTHVRAILSAHGIEPPEIDGWAWEAQRQGAS